jgi:nucleoside-diphosphate-sugar epimerase
VRIVRLSGVFGPLERPTRGRAIMSPVWHLAEAVAADRALRVTAQTHAAGGDFLSAEDIAGAVALLLTAGGLRHRVYNIAAGSFTTIAELAAAAGRAGSPVRLQTVDGEADLDLDPGLRLARWNAYATDRLRADVPWEPRPLEEQLRTYLSWRRDA